MCANLYDLILLIIFTIYFRENQRYPRHPRSISSPLKTCDHLAFFATISKFHQRIVTSKSRTILRENKILHNRIFDFNYKDYRHGSNTKG
jgi:hypothetical protein